MSRGPFVTKLIIEYMTINAIPPGGGLADAVEFFKNPEHRKQILNKAEINTLEAIRLIKTAPDNPYGNDDEIIAEELLIRIKERKRQIKNDQN